MKSMYGLLLAEEMIVMWVRIVLLVCLCSVQCQKMVGSDVGAGGAAIFDRLKDPQTQAKGQPPASQQVTDILTSGTPKMNDSQSTSGAQVQGAQTETTRPKLRESGWLPELPGSLQDIIPPFDDTGLPPAREPALRVFVFDRVNLRPVSGFAMYSVSPATVGGPFVTNSKGFAHISISSGWEKSNNVELELFANYQPLLSGEVRLWPSNAPDRRFRLSLSKLGTRETEPLLVVPVVRAEVAVFELPYRRMINVPVTMTPLNAVVREPLTLPAGAEDEVIAARFAIPAHEGDTYRVSIGENPNTGPKDIGIFTVRAYREPIELRINLYVGPPPLEVITTEH